MTMKRIDNKETPRVALRDKDGDEYVVIAASHDMISISRNGTQDIIIYASDWEPLTDAIQEVATRLGYIG